METKSEIDMNILSPIDQLFVELYDSNPTKAGQAYEKIVAATLKLVTGVDYNYDQHMKGTYSNTDFQLDAHSPQASTMVEAKDYSIDGKKVGRGDIQKQVGALGDLPIKQGIFASATDYTIPAKKYANSTRTNPSQKPIDLFHIRPSTELDRKGRVERIIINVEMIIYDFEHAQYQIHLSENAIKLLKNNNLINEILDCHIENIYNIHGDITITFNELINKYAPSISAIPNDDGLYHGSWIFFKEFIPYRNLNLEINRIDYAVKRKTAKRQIIVDAQGTPKILVKSEDGSINKLITDEQLKTVRFECGRVII